MASPFPGMDPYLENPALWSEVHNRLIVAIANDLETKLSLDYRVAIERRTYLALPEDSVLVGIPDVVVSQSSKSTEKPTQVIPQSVTASQATTVTLPIPVEVRESYLEIRDLSTGYVVTAIELLSPANKAEGKGREAYLAKRLKVLGSPTHLVEIDLLRGGQPMPTSEAAKLGSYRILVSRGDRRPMADLWAFGVREPIPEFPVPLRSGEEAPVLNLKQLLEQVYAQARYGSAIDYGRSPIPALKAKDRAWASQLTR